ncbi:SprT family zinc-dependent metalloprotease [Rhodopseudomonas palustris]|uniref:M48 family metallopeptidase n=1 Tax=Rhodopseudomonas palustris TaxID=1076 RepID=UPI002ACEE868|nr:SprT family zinc-dependent metalloprotease [Rhodopseudomonas palustris]WQG98384.1 SprT family zinc-dependent metalloprotease [Rhodopseudomonas palustris]
MRGSVAYANQRIDYSARHSSRKTLEITVHPDGAVEIVAPAGIGQQVIEKRLIRRASWVLQQRRYFEQFLPRTPARRYVGGETHLYLGRQFRLKVRVAERSSVRLKAGFFEVVVAGQPSPECVRSLLEQWYRRHADEKLSMRFETLLARFPHVATQRLSLVIRPMKRRWGSHSARGRITLNRDLIRAPLPCIDYVIVHELAHARHPNHGRAFFELMTQMMPDWERRKLALERMLA